jgi:hypothetical protein
MNINIDSETQKDILNRAVTKLTNDWEPKKKGDFLRTCFEEVADENFNRSRVPKLSPTIIKQ